LFEGEVCFVNTYLLAADLYGGLRYPALGQLGLGLAYDVFIPFLPTGSSSVMVDEGVALVNYHIAYSYSIYHIAYSYKLAYSF